MTTENVENKSDLSLEARVEALEREVAALREITGALTNGGIKLTAPNGQFCLALHMTDHGALQIHLLVPDAEGHWKEQAMRTWLSAARQTYPPHSYYLMGSAS